MDFTLKKYNKLLTSFLGAGYTFQTFEEFLQNPKDKVVILRHDVDLKALNSLKTAQIEQGLGIKSSYYFRVIPQSNQPDIIKQIIGLGHEIGYHYEDLSLFKGDENKAIKHFEKQLAYFRQFYPVKTICMHGSPMSKINNIDIWNNYNYKDFGLIGEPYFDIDFDKVFYLTDTGRCWDGQKYSVRDKVNTIFKQSYHTTDEIIKAVSTGDIPNQIMITTHPQRWSDNLMEWCKELIVQNVKNCIKQIIVSHK